MFNTLRSRLLLSYIGVIAIALWVVAMSLLFFATRPGVRYLSTMQHLAAVGTSNRQELFRLLETGADTPAYERLLNETAVTNNVRVLIADISSNKIGIIHHSFMKRDSCRDSLYDKFVEGESHFSYSVATVVSKSY